VFHFNGTQWELDQELVASDGKPFDSFGISVAIDGSVIAVGASHAGPPTGEAYGAAYVFRFDGTQWKQEQKLVASDRRDGDEFGSSVAVRGDVLAVGAQGHKAGSVYVFRYLAPQQSWQQDAELTASDAGAADELGAAVAMLDETLIVAGAPRADKGGDRDVGAAYVFRFNGALWVEEKLEASDGAAQDLFGFAVDVQGDLLVVGAPGDETAAGTAAGSVHVFRASGGQYLEEQQLFADDGSVDDYFGWSVAARGDLVFAGAWGEDGGLGDVSERITGIRRARRPVPPDLSAGAAYLFRFAGPHCRWVQDVKKTASFRHENAHLGRAVALSDHHAFAGLNDDSVRVFDTAELTLDIDPLIVSPGQTLTFVTSCGIPHQPVALAATRINGAPILSILLIREFNGDCRWTIAATVPPGLSGLTVSFQTFKASDSCRDQTLRSNEVTVIFQ
jgi:hypothetical protein